MVFLMVCINSLVRKQWTEHEKLSYPIIQLPLELTSGGRTNLLTNKMMWLGFGLRVQLTSSMGFTTSIRVCRVWVGRLYDLRPFFTQKPWSAVVGHLSLFFRLQWVSLSLSRLICRFHAGFSIFFWKVERVFFWRCVRVRGMPNLSRSRMSSLSEHISVCLLSRLWRRE